MYRHFLIAFSIAAVLLLTACNMSAPAAPGQADTAGDPSLVVTIKETKNEAFVIRFVNRSDKPVRILKPLDGSYYSWIMPHYAFSLEDGKGTTFDKRMRCGNFGHPFTDTKWPEDYLVEIGPGKTHEEVAILPFYIPEDGEYKVTFTYMFTPATSKLPTGEHTYPERLWKGKATSNSIRVRLKALHPVVG